MNAPKSTTTVPSKSNGGRFVYDKEGNLVSHTPCTKQDTKVRDAKVAAPTGEASADAPVAAPSTTTGKRAK